MIRANSPTMHCGVEFYGQYTAQWGSGVRWLFSIDSYGLHVRKNTEEWKTISDPPHELKVAAACLCAGLMPPSVFADLLEDHRPDLAEAAAFLREWERVHKEQQK